MTEVSQHEINSIPDIEQALGKLKQLRASIETNPAGPLDGITKHDLDAIILHVESTMGNFSMPDVPM